MARKAVLALAVVAAAALGIFAIAALLASRDNSTVTPDAGPGVVRPAASRPVVAPGNVVLLYSDERLTSDLRALAADIGGPPDPALVAAGQAVVVRHRLNQRVPVIAVTAKRRLDASAPGDPALRAFAEYWLGRR
jgi:hypothetical protein